jgi:hypothetical protein
LRLVRFPSLLTGTTCGVREPAEFLAKRAESESLKSCSSQTLSNATESLTLHSWVYAEAEDGEAFFLEATSGMLEVEAG